MEWSNLIDLRTRLPQLTIQSKRATWKHIVQDHIAHESWEILLPDRVVTAIRRIDWSQLQHVQDDPALMYLIGYLEDQARQSMLRPLVIQYQLTRRSHSDERWILVLPSGAKMVLRIDPADQSCHLVTCYLPQNGFSAAFDHAFVSSRNRWRRTVSRMVDLHCMWMEGHGLVPQQSRIVPRRRQLPFESRDKIRFEDPEEWGFQTDTNPHVWRGLLKPWRDTTETDQVKGTRKRRLTAMRASRQLSGDET